MKILQIGLIPPEIGGKTIGGVATHIWQLATCLVKRNHSLAILADNYYLTTRGPEVKECVSIYGRRRLIHNSRIGSVLKPRFWNKIVRTKRHFNSLTSWKNIIYSLLFYHSVIKSFQPDVIHVHHLEHRFPFAYFTTNDNIPIITTVHSTSFIDFCHQPIKDFRLQFVRRNLDLARNLIFVSHALQKKYKLLFKSGLDHCQTHTIHNPIDSSLYYPLPKEEARRKLGKKTGEQLILFVGNLGARKGVNILIEAVKLLKAEGRRFQLLIVGDGPQRVALRSLVLKYDLARNISLIGLQVYPTLLYYYNAADIMVLPSSSEGFPIVVLEALACGCPVIGIKDVVDEAIVSDDLGYKCSAEAKSLMEQLQKALNKNWDKSYIAKYALRYDWQNQLPLFEVAYEKAKNYES